MASFPVGGIGRHLGMDELPRSYGAVMRMLCLCKLGEATGFALAKGRASA